MERLISFLGLIVMMILAWLLSNNKRKLPVRTIISGVLLQFIFAILILKIPFTKNIFNYLVTMVNGITTLSDQGALFLFGKDFTEHYFSFKVLPTIIFVSSVFSVLFYLGIIQKVVLGLAWCMKRLMATSGVESLVAAANVFIGQTEAPLVIKPYLKTMTDSEIMSMMVSGMATISGSVLVAFVGMGVSAEHLISASLISAPASLVIAKIMQPELNSELQLTQKIRLNLKSEDVNIFAAACRGASDGIKLCIGIVAMLIAFISIVALINYVLAACTPSFLSNPLTFEGILGFLMRPLAFIMGVPWNDCDTVGQLLGEKMVINEFYAYLNLSSYIKAGALSERSITIVTYALCGFANFSSIAIQIGGIGELEPSKRDTLARMGLKSMLGGSLVTFMTACIAGILI